MIKIYTTKVPLNELKSLAEATYKDMVKGVVDVDQKIIALGGELHADCEEVLLEKGSRQVDLWGFNIYLEKSRDERLEYTSFINIRPKQGNLQIEIKNPELRSQIKTIIDALID